MSQWRQAVRALYDIGKPTDTLEVADRIVDNTNATRHALASAREMGLAVGGGRHGNAPSGWALTQLGVDYCEGRLQIATHDRTGRRPFIGNGMRLPRFMATWLASLPRGVRIEQSPSTYPMKEAA